MSIFEKRHNAKSHFFAALDIETNAEARNLKKKKKTRIKKHIEPEIVETTFGFPK